MKLQQGKEKFVKAWGRLGANWGINRTMAQIHALLLISAEPLNADQIMDELKISRGNVNMNLRTLLNWDLVHKEIIRGDRKEYFIAEKNINLVAKRIIKERRKRELEPIIHLLADLQQIEGDKKDKNIKAYLDTLINIAETTKKANQLAEFVIKADDNKLINALLKFMP